MIKNNWHPLKTDLQEWSNREGGGNAHMAVEGGDEAITAVRDDQESPTHPLWY